MFVQSNSIQESYQIENIYKINKESALEIHLEEGKKYKIQYFFKDIAQYEKIRTKIVYKNKK